MIAHPQAEGKRFLHMKLSEQERLDHMAEVVKVFDHPYIEDALAVLSLNFDQVGIDLFSETPGETVIRVGVEQFVKVVAMTTRLLALGIDPEDAIATEEEREDIRKNMQERIGESAKAVVVQLDKRGRVIGSGGH